MTVCVRKFIRSLQDNAANKLCSLCQLGATVNSCNSSEHIGKSECKHIQTSQLIRHIYKIHHHADHKQTGIV